MTGSPLLQCRHVNKYRGKQTLSSRGVSCLHTHWLTEGLGDNTPSLGASFPWRLKPVSFSILYMWAMPEDPVALTLSEGGSSVLKSHTSLGSCSLLAIVPVLVIWPSCLQDSDFGPLSPSAPTCHQLSVAVHTLGWHICEWVLDPWETFLTNWKGTLTGTWEMHDVLRGPNPAWWRASPWTQLCS